MFRNVLIENELLPGSKPTVRVYGETSGKEKSNQANKVGSTGTNIHLPEAGNAVTVPSPKPDVGDFHKVLDVVIEQGSFPDPHVIEHMTGGGFVPVGNSPWFNAAAPTDKAGVYATVRVTGAATPLPVQIEHAVHVTFFDAN
ncbi:hypothetical protein [Trinickia sp. EG282A]|uniref:hypothetical protein n=1 Tax=Trinickia sp. EG282A TaxID=3237013 RepID=UPI0034D2B055